MLKSKCVCVLAPLGTRWPLVQLSFPLLCSLSRGPGPRVTAVCAQRPGSSAGGARETKTPHLLEAVGTPGACVALLQLRLERAMIRVARFIYTHIHTHTRANTHSQPTEQPVFRAPQDYCFDSQGETIVIERTSDTCVVISWRGDTGHTHTHTRLRARSMSSQWINV